MRNAPDHRGVAGTFVAEDLTLQTISHAGIGFLPTGVQSMLAALLLLSLATPVEPSATVVLKDVHGRSHQPLAVPPGKRVNLVLFITSDCPISNGYAPEINRIVAAYAPQGVAVFLTHVDKDVDRSVAAKHAAEYGFKSTVLLDPAHKLVAALGATVTPEAFVVDQRGAILYRGRIDDRWPSLGVQREPRTRDLRAALEAVLAGKRVPTPRTKAVGCFIPNVRAQ